MTTPQQNEDTRPQEAPDIEPDFRARYLTIMAQWQAGETEFADALHQLEAMRQEAMKANNYANLGGLATIVGILYGYRGNYDNSARFFESARQYHERAGSERYIPGCDLNLGEVYRLRGNFNRAKMFFRRAYDRAKELEDVQTQSIALTNEGQMWLSLGSIKKARETLEQALALTVNPYTDDETEHQTDSRLGTECEIQHALASVCLEEKKLDDAWQHAKRSYELAQKDNEQWHRIGQGYRAVADVISAVGHAPDDDFNDDADEYYKAALKAFREAQAEGEVGKTLFSQGMSMMKRGKTRSSARLLQQAMEIFTKLGMTDDAAKAAEAQMKIF